MNKHNVISDAIEAIPGWLAFLDAEEAKQVAILEEIQQQQAGALLEGEDVSALHWLDDDAPPPTGEPQTPTSLMPEADGDGIDEVEESEESPDWEA